MRLTETDFAKAFEAVIAPDDDVVMIFSGLWTFAHRFGWEADTIAGRLLTVIEECVGEHRTLMFPTFMIETYPRSRTYDVRRSIPDIGTLPQSVVGRRGYVRTRKPMYNYAIRGPRARQLLDLPDTTSWSETSIMGWFGTANARICSLGLPWHESCSFLHRAEEAVRVPYRYYKRFPGTLLDDGVPQGPCEEIMYVRSIDVFPYMDFRAVAPRMDAQGAIAKSGNPLIPVESIKARSMLDVTTDLLTDDPYAYIVNKDEVKAWVRDGKAAEMARLPAAERCPDLNGGA